MRKQTILAIDDDPRNLGLLSELLKDRNVTLLVAEDGESGLERTRYARPDLILLDVLLSGTNGFETCRRLKLEETTKDIPVIFMTALGDIEYKVKGFECGGIDYITKPFQREEVLARVEVHLKARALAESLQEANASLGRRVEERTAELARANRILKSDIEEKNELLREVHHRVMNNLQVMASLLDMSLRSVADPASRTLYEDLAGRLRAISEVHEQIYNTEDYSSIDIGEYVGKLADILRQGCRGASTEPDVTIKADPIQLGLEQAVPLGILVNEILTNCFRHAFPENLPRRGAVSVELRSLPGSVIELTISDNGIGLAGESEQPARMGLTLISLMQQQLGAELELTREEGTSYRIRLRKA